MKLKNTIITSLLIGGILALTPSCKKGCTDTAANNFSEKAKKDDGTCTYDPIITWYTEVVIGGVTYKQLPTNVTSDQTMDAASNW